MIGFTRKSRMTTIIAAFLFAAIFLFAAPLIAASPITITIDGQQLVLDDNSGQPVLIDERTYVPLRVVSENLGAKVDWINETRQVIINTKSDLFTYTIPQNLNDEIQIIIDGQPLIIPSDYGMAYINRYNRTMIPLRAVGEALGCEVNWINETNTVQISSKPAETEISDNIVIPDHNNDVPIMGIAQATSTQLRTLLKSKNSAAPDLVDLYLQIGQEYGIRGDIAFCQAAKETGWWKFTGDVQPIQNNYCGLYALGRPLTEQDSCNGADPNYVWLEVGKHGATFISPAAGVEAHIQHLYAYATKKDLPPGKVIIDPRFKLLDSKRGSAPCWQDLGGKWAPSTTYGQSIINDYWALVN